MFLQEGENMFREILWNKEDERKINKSLVHCICSSKRGYFQGRVLKAALLH